MTSHGVRRALPGSVRILLGLERPLRDSGMKLVGGEESAWFREAFSVQGELCLLQGGSFQFRENSVWLREGLIWFSENSIWFREDSVWFKENSVSFRENSV